MLRDKFKILVVDDEESICEFFTIMLNRFGYGVDVANDGMKALIKLKKQRYDLVISDIRMPHADGFEVLQFIKKCTPETIVILITAFSSTEQAVRAMKKGAHDYITKPFDNEGIRLIIKNALESRALRQENKELKEKLRDRYSFCNIVGKAKSMQKTYDLIRKVAANNVNALITGESGTGKELVARAIHYNSDRRSGMFVGVNCGAIPENLLESELFGHEKGSFTGAIRQKIGLFEKADKGSIFLDEIGELPWAMQIKLLRVLQEREFRRVGGIEDIRTDIRLISATNKDLEALVDSGDFRKDFFYRINVIQIPLPPLRKRSEDIPLLIEHFYQKLIGKSKVRVSEKAMRYLLDYNWPGNIRELENVIERCIVLGQTETIIEESLPQRITKKIAPRPTKLGNIFESEFELDSYLGGIEHHILLKALEKSGGSHQKAAKLLGISPRSIRYRISKFGIFGEMDG